MRCEVCNVDFTNAGEQAAHWRDVHEAPKLRELEAERVMRAARPGKRRRKAPSLPAQRPELAIVHVGPSGPFTRRPESIRVNPSLLPIDYINELDRLRDRFMDVLLDLPPEQVWHIVGEIAILGNIADRAEEASALVRREKERSQAAALRELAVARHHMADTIEQEPYLPPPTEARRHFPRRA